MFFLKSASLPSKSPRKPSRRVSFPWAFLQHTDNYTKISVVHMRSHTWTCTVFSLVSVALLISAVSLCYVHLSDEGRCMCFCTVFEYAHLYIELCSPPQIRSPSITIYPQLNHFLKFKAIFNSNFQITSKTSHNLVPHIHSFIHSKTAY